MRWLWGTGLLLGGLLLWLALDRAAGGGRSRPGLEPGQAVPVAVPHDPEAAPGAAAPVSTAPAAPRTVRARVGSLAGAPIEGAEVRVTNDDLRAIARTDAAGVALVPTDGRSVVWVEARKAGFRTAEAVAPGGQDDVLILLEPGAPVRGRIVRAADGRPVPGALVRIADRASCEELDREVEADGEGRFLFCGVAPGAAFLVGARAPGFGPATVAGVAGTGEVVVALGSGASVSGTVLGPDGRPAAAATVWLRPEDDQFLVSHPDHATFGYRTFRASAAAVCDADGRYALAGLGAPETYAALARDADGAEAQATLVARRADDVLALDLALNPTGRILVCAVDPRGRPAGRSRLRIVSEAGKWVHGATVPQFTGADGAALVSGLEAGTYEIVAQPERWAAGRAHVTVPAGGTAQAEIRATEGLALEGAVEDAAGRPIAGVDVRFGTPGDARAPPQYSTTATDGRGRFRLEGLLPGRGRLEVSDWAGRWREWQDDSAEPGAAPRRIVLAPTAAVGGRLAPAPAARRGSCIVVDAEGAGERDISFDEEGRFEICDLPEGVDVTLVFDTPDAAPLRVAVAPLGPGERRELGTLAVLAGRTLRGRVLDGDGVPLGDMTVQLYEDDLLDRFALTDAEGFFAFEHVDPRASVGITTWTGESSGPYFEIGDWTSKPVHELVVERR